MRILYLSPTEPYPGAHAGFTHVHNLLKHLCAAGVEVTLIAGEPEIRAAIAEEVPGLTIHYIPSGHPIVRNYRVLGKILCILKRKKFDLIHERYEIAGGAGMIASGISRIPLVIEVNDPLLELNADPFARLPLTILKRLQFCNASAIICQTPYIKKILWSCASHPRVFVIPNGADPSRFLTTPFPETKRIGFIGSFMPWHGTGVLLRAFQRVLHEEPEADLILIGNPGTQRKIMEAQLQKLGIANRVTMTGGVPSGEVPELLSSCMVLTAPFTPEYDNIRTHHYKQFGFWWSPLKIFEYMAASRPVVTPDLGMIPKYIGKAGLTYPSGDEKALAERIITLLRDREMSIKMGIEGRKRVERLYNWRTIAHITLMAYTNVLERQ